MSLPFDLLTPSFSASGQALGIYSCPKSYTYIEIGKHRSRKLPQIIYAKNNYDWSESYDEARR